MKTHHEILVDQTFEAWKKLCLKNNSIPAFMFGINPLTGIDVFAEQKIGKDMMIATMRQCLDYWENSDQKNGNKIIQMPN